MRETLVCTVTASHCFALKGLLLTCPFVARYVSLFISCSFPLLFQWPCGFAACLELPSAFPTVHCPFRVESFPDEELHFRESPGLADAISEDPIYFFKLSFKITNIA